MEAGAKGLPLQWIITQQKPHQELALCGHDSWELLQQIMGGYL